jgi:hypothetical protein
MWFPRAQKCINPALCSSPSRIIKLLCSEFSTKYLFIDENVVLAQKLFFSIDVSSKNIVTCIGYVTNTWRISFYRLSTDRIENTSPDVLLEGLFISQLPSKKLKWCIHYCCPHSLLRECLRSSCLVTMTFFYCCAFEHAYKAVAW